MSQPNRKRQHLHQEVEEDNAIGNELREPELKMAALEVQQQIPKPMIISGIFTILNYQFSGQKWCAFRRGLGKEEGRK
jgi:hypothetical protein